MKSVPLPRTFMLMSILGILIFTVYTSSGRIPLPWGFAFVFVCFLGFIASMLSITPSWIDPSKPVSENSEIDHVDDDEAKPTVMSLARPRRSSRPARKPARKSKSKPKSQKKVVKKSRPKPRR